MPTPFDVYRPSRAERAFGTTLGLCVLLPVAAGFVYCSYQVIIHNPWLLGVFALFGLVWAIAYRFTPP